MRSKDEELEFQELQGMLYVGFCISGYVQSDRTPAACQVHFDALNGKPSPQKMAINSHYFWGAPNMILRLMFGSDPGIASDIVASGKWTGTVQELQAILDGYRLGHGILPIRDAVDFVYSCIYSTIKAMKFSSLHQICGGPIEVAVITTDRPFRWVKHKAFDAAISEGEP